jgi:hypothetical protein
MKTKEFNEEIKKYKENEKRNYRSQQDELDHDLYKLEVAIMKQDKGIEGKSKNFVDVEHCHFYHSIDSSGKKQKYASSIGGHTHEVKTWVNENGELVGSCGNSIIFHNGKEYQLKHSESIHAHDVVYITSDKIQPRVINKEASKVIGQIK